MFVRRTAMAIALGWVTAGGCTCGADEVIGRVAPRLDLPSAALDFGEVPLGATKRLALDLVNGGAAPLTVSAITATVPFAASLPSVTVPAGGRARLDVAFTPVDAGEVQGALQITSDADGQPTASVALRGVGVPGFLEVRPRAVDFARTRVGTSRRVALVIDNRGLESVGGPVVAEDFARPEHFTLDGVPNLDAAVPFSVPPRAETTLELEYLPLAIGDDAGRLLFQTCGDRCGVDVVVTADAVAASVRVEPSAVDLGEVGIGGSKTEVVTVFNDGTQPLTVARARILNSPEVSVSSARALPVDLSPGGSLALTVDYRPTAATELVAHLSIETSDEGAPEARVRISGRGVGPLFQVLPEAIDFGVVHRTVAQRRSFVLLNSGSADVRVQGVSYRGHASLSLVGVPGLPVRLGAGEAVTPSVQLVPTGTAGIYRGEVVIDTDDPTHAQVVLPVVARYSETACQLEVSPARLNFGLLTPPYQRTQEVTLRNGGDRACTLQAGAFSQPSDPAFHEGMSMFPVTLGPGQSVMLPFTFAPVDRRESKAVYVVTTDDATFPERPVTLVGSSLAYDDLFLVPTSIDFGMLEPRCVGRGRALRLFNAGTLDAVIEQVNMRGAVGEVQLMGGGAPHTILPGSSWDLSMAYAPTDLGVDQGEVEFVPRDRPYSLVANWRGEGVPNAVISETFEQGEARPVDVLFVVDDSCSMGEEQSALVTNFADFINTANVRSVDFRMAITTTDVTGANAGRLRGPIMSPRTSNLAAEFTRQANVGTSGSGFEQGLEAMNSVFRTARSRNDFLRSSASLVVIIVSDEDDGSPASPVAYFNSVMNVNSDYFVATITGQGTGCFSAGTGNATAAPKYEAFVALTGGLSLSICAPWAATLSNLGAAVFGLEHRFPLGNAADMNSSVTVIVNGNPVPSTDWRYDANPPAIVFDVNAIPPEGSTIVVTYSPDC